MKAFFAALAFLTRLPIPKMEIREKDWLKSSLYYPVVGLLLGFLLYGFIILTSGIFSSLLQAALLLAFWIFLTGGLHLDGWMDVADGLGSNQPREKVFEIMKDSRVGAIGALMAIIILLVKVTAIHDLLGISFTHVIIIPMVARLILLYAIAFYPYKGALGDGLKKYITRTNLFFITSSSIIVSYFILGNDTFIFLPLVFFSGYLFIRLLYRKLGTLNGDCYGAIVEFMEAASLIILLVLWGL